MTARRAQLVITADYRDKTRHPGRVMRDTIVPQDKIRLHLTITHVQLDTTAPRALLNHYHVRMVLT